MIGTASLYWDPDREHHQMSSWPHKVSSLPSVSKFSHYYTYNTMLGCVDTSHPHNTLDFKQTYREHCPDDVGVSEVSRDVNVPQICYKTHRYCHNTWSEVTNCNCLHCVTLHTAKLPDITKLDKDETIYVRCYEPKRSANGTVIHDIKKPVLRRGVNSREDRPEFVVTPACIDEPPRLAKNPHLYYVKDITGYGDKYVRQPYVEFEDAKYSNVRYVLGDY